MNMRKICSAVFGLPRTLWFNYRYLPLSHGVQLLGSIINREAHKIYDDFRQLIINTAPIVIEYNVCIASNVNIIKRAVILAQNSRL